MKKYITLFAVIFISTAYSQVNFDDYFLDKSLRIDYYHFGDSINDYYAIDELIEEPYWGGSKKNLLDIFNFGDYIIKVLDKETGELIFSKTYTTLFSEWQTVDEAKEIIASETPLPAREPRGASRENPATHAGARQPPRNGS